MAFMHMIARWFLTRSRSKSDERVPRSHPICFSSVSQGAIKQPSQYFKTLLPFIFGEIRQGIFDYFRVAEAG